MDFNADTLLAVRRQPTDRRIGKVRLADIRKLHWRRQSGGIKSRFMAQPFVFGLIRCTDIAEGRIAHSCQHGPPPHEVLVCMCQKDNPAALATFIAHIANLEPAIRERQRATGADHWLAVAQTMLTEFPVPAKLTRSKQGQGKKRQGKRRYKRVEARRRRLRALSRRATALKQPSI